MKTVEDINKALEELDEFQKEVDEYRQELLALKKQKKKEKDDGEPPQFKCNVAMCGKKYNTRKHLRRHFQMKHLGMKEKRNTRTCLRCGRIFKRSSHLKYHNDNVCN